MAEPSEFVDCSNYAAADSDSPETPESIVVSACSCDNDKNSLSPSDIRTIDLPGANWSFHESTDTSLTILEATKRVIVDLATGWCASYVMDQKISDARASSASDVERCVEELDMTNVCVGGRAAITGCEDRPDVRVDATGKWRHNRCKIVVPVAGTTCEVCRPLRAPPPPPPDVEPTTGNKRTRSNDDDDDEGLTSVDDAIAKRVNLGALSHRKQSLIVNLRKYLDYHCRRKKEAERQIEHLKEMIEELLEGRDNQDDDDDDDDDDASDDDDFE